MNIFDLLSNVLCFVLHVTDTESFPRPLTKKEEEQEIEKMKNGDEAARLKLIEHNLRLVAHIVKKYYTPNLDQDDLISVGTIGLIKGINSFNADKKVKLATYCARCIENEILMYFRNVKKLNSEISFNDPIDTDSEGNPLTLMDIIATEDTIIDDIDTLNKLTRLTKLIKNMPESREKEIIILRYGLNQQKAMTQKEVAKKLKISRSYVSRIEKKLLSDLRKLL